MVWPESPMSSLHFPQWKIFFLIHIWEWNIWIIYVKFKMWPSFFMWIPHLIFNSEAYFSQFSLRFKILILKCWSWVVYTFRFFPVHKRNGELGFLKSLDCTSKFSPTKKFENWDFCPFAFTFCQMVRIVCQ